MYTPLSQLLNLVLDKLSEADVTGLPKFKGHIVCAPVDEVVTPGRPWEGSRIKPDVAILTLETACIFRDIDWTPDLTPLQFIEGIPARTTSPRRPRKEGKPLEGPDYCLSWNDVLSVIEVKRDKDEEWSNPAGPNETNSGPSHKPLASPDSSQSETREFPSPSVCTPLRVRIVTTPTFGESEGHSAPNIGPSFGTLEKSKKRSAPDAGFSSGPSNQSKKWKRTPRQPRGAELNQTWIYAGEKLSDSHSTSHTINLIIDRKSVV